MALLRIICFIVISSTLLLCAVSCGTPTATLSASNDTAALTETTDQEKAEPAEWVYPSNIHCGIGGTFRFRVEEDTFVWEELTDAEAWTAHQIPLEDAFASEFCPTGDSYATELVLGRADGAGQRLYLAFAQHVEYERNPQTTYHFFLSEDGGTTWTDTMASDPPLHGRTSSVCAADMSADGVGCVAVYLRQPGVVNALVLYVTYDGGTTWTQTGALDEPPRFTDCQPYDVSCEVCSNRNIQLHFSITTYKGESLPLTYQKHPDEDGWRLLTEIPPSPPLTGK